MGKVISLICAVFALLFLPMFIDFAQGQEESSPESTSEVSTNKDEQQAPEPQIPHIAQEIEVTCPLDGNPVKVYEIKGFVSTGTDRDFCEKYAGRSLYDLWVSCSESSGYCGYLEDFTVKLSQKQKARLRKKIAKYIRPEYNLKRLKPWDRYAIAAQIYIWLKKPEMEIANAYLRATYTMRKLPLGPQDRELEKELRAKAIKYMKKALRQGQLPLQHMANTNYLIGELYRRNEKFQKAIKYYENTLKFKNREEWVDQWVNEQMAKAYAEYAL